MNRRKFLSAVFVLPLVGVVPLNWKRQDIGDTYIRWVVSRCASAAQDIGISFEQLVRVIVKVHNKIPISADRLANALKTIFVRLKRVGIRRKGDYVAKWGDWNPTEQAELVKIFGGKYYKYKQVARVVLPLIWGKG